jgi:hypothetical protein
MFICILGLLAASLWSTSAFAQASLSVSSVPRTTAISTGHTEIAGDILVQSGGAGGLGAGSATLTIDYKVPITVPAAGFITVCGTGTLAGIGGATAGCAGGVYTPNATGASGTFQIGGVNQNQLLIVLPATPAGTGAGDTVTVNGVKVSLAAYTGTVLTAALGVSAPTGFGAYSIGAGQNASDVISFIAPAFTTAVMTGATATPAGTGSGQILTTTSVSDRTFNIDIPETFVDAFKSTLGQNGYLNDAALTLTFSGIPNGVFLNLVGGTTGTTNAACTAATGTGTDSPAFYVVGTNNFTAIPSSNLTNTVISNSTNSTVLSFTGLTFNLTQLEAIRLRGCLYTSGATAPLTAGTIAAAITLSPNGAALGTTTPPQITPVAGNFPRYQTSLVNVNVATIVAAETDMLISFASRNTSGFDTGIAVANTSTDPFGTNGITPNDGTVTLNFYPQGSGTPFTYTTAAGSPGLGLSATGVLVSGKTWSVGLSELLGAITGAPTSFTGYIFVRANFTNAHGAAYITDYKGFTSGSPFLIVPLSRPSVNESLGH